MHDGRESDRGYDDDATLLHLIAPLLRPNNILNMAT